MSNYDFEDSGVLNSSSFGGKSQENHKILKKLSESLMDGNSADVGGWEQKKPLNKDN